MTKYGIGKKRKKSSEPVPDEDIIRPLVDEYSPYNELCKFVKEYKLHIELDKPFIEMDQMMLAITDKDKNIIKKITVDDLESLDIASGKILNELGKKYK